MFDYQLFLKPKPHIVLALAAESVIVKRVFRAEKASLITNYSWNQGHIMSGKKGLLRAASSKKCVIRKTQL